LRNCNIDETGKRKIIGTQEGIKKMNAVREMRQKRKLSQTELARRAKLSQSIISHIERGARPLTASTLVRIASVLRVSVTSLL